MYRADIKFKQYCERIRSTAMHRRADFKLAPLHTMGNYVDGEEYILAKEMQMFVTRDGGPSHITN